ncbi:hypothetical protein AVEN_20336-1 [Araneus ventricosus]|uniref:Uncharacterized protein n=1 Tax=Araneus ventricosus TaxID=182803 RepID=A0A4Y2IP14_ARAVE|nr:hypothetical protein AVEN_20336-1 [Araneus ventricosus]
MYTVLHNGMDLIISNLDSGIPEVLKNQVSSSNISTCRLSSELDFVRRKSELYHKMRNNMESYQKEVADKPTQIKDVFMMELDVLLSDLEPVHPPTKVSETAIQKPPKNLQFSVGNLHS